VKNTYYNNENNIRPEGYAPWARERSVKFTYLKRI